ncbi:MAG: hypothetical protein ABSA10_10435 [Anaerolineales bacterium]
MQQHNDRMAAMMMEMILGAELYFAGAGAGAAGVSVILSSPHDLRFIFLPGIFLGEIQFMSDIDYTLSHGKELFNPPLFYKEPLFQACIHAITL